MNGTSSNPQFVARGYHHEPLLHVQPDFVLWLRDHGWSRTEENGDTSLFYAHKDPRPIAVSVVTNDIRTVFVRWDVRKEDRG